MKRLTALAAFLLLLLLPAHGPRWLDTLPQAPVEPLTDRELADFFRETLHDLDRIIDKEFTLDGGYTRTLSLSLMPLVKGGAIQGNVIHIEDITERRTRDARLRRA